jgi:hypothetical protein
MELNWETFVNPRPLTPPNLMRVTLSQRGDIYLNRCAVEALGWPAAVTLMYDRGRNIVGIKPADPDDPGSYPLRNKGGTRSRSRGLFAASFCRHFQIAPTKPVHIRDPRMDKDGVLIIDLNDAVPSAGRFRRFDEER